MPQLIPKFDNDFLNRLRQEEALAFEELYRFAFHYCTSFIRKNNGSKMDAQDIFQESILVLLDKIRSEDFTLTTDLRGFLYSINKHLWLKALRKKGKMPLAEESEKEWMSIEEDISKEKQEFELNLELVEEKMNELEKTCKEVLLAYFYEKKSLEEIAEKLGMKDRRFSGMKKQRCLKKLIKLVKASMEKF